MNDEHLELLRRIAKDVADIKAAMAASIGASAAALGVQAAGSSSGGAAGGVAPARELDSQYGDPEIKRDPKRWTGESFAGCHYSETTPDYLDCVAEFKDWQADQDDKAGAKDAKGRPKSGWGRKDARLARGWAARMRAPGWKPKAKLGVAPPPATDEDYGDGFGEDQIPF